MIDVTQFSTMSIKELLTYIVDEFHIPLRKDLIEMRQNGIWLMKTCEQSEKLQLVMTLFNQFETEFLNHINTEENEFFLWVLKLEKWEKFEKKFIHKFFNTQDREHKEIKSYLKNWLEVLNHLCLDDNEYYLNLKKLLNKMIEDTKIHTYLEDEILKEKIEELI